MSGDSDSLREWQLKNNGRAEALPLLVLARSACCRNAKLLGGQFFLFAFHAHLFELALFGFDRRSDFLLDLGCRFFQLRRELNVAGGLPARTGGDQAAADDVLLEAAQRVYRAVDAGFGEDAGGL